MTDLVNILRERHASLYGVDSCPSCITEAANRIQELERHIEQLRGLKFSDRNYGAMQSRLAEAERQNKELRKATLEEAAAVCESYGDSFIGNTEIGQRNQRIAYHLASEILGLKEPSHD